MFDINYRFSRLEEVAKKIASLSDFKYQVGAVVFNKGRIISVGYNSTKTHTKLMKYFSHATLHAECDAVLHCPNPDALDGASMIVYRTKKNGSPAMSKPCPMCRQIMFEYGIKKVYWSTDQFPFWDNAKVEDLFNEVDHKMCYHNNRIQS
jgi:deoxycytidylate deaminase